MTQLQLIYWCKTKLSIVVIEIKNQENNDMKHRKLLSTLIAASMTISVVGNVAPAVFADTIEDSEEIVVTDEEEETEEASDEIIEETEAIEETDSEIVEETDVQEEAEQTEADQEIAEETSESEAAEEISESEISEETIETSEIENDEIINQEDVTENIEEPAVVENEIAEVIFDAEADVVVESETPVVETETEKEAELPLFCEETTVNGILVTVKADRGVFPVGSYIAVTPVNDAKANALVSESRDDNVNVAYSMTFDITVYNAEGIEIEPDNSKGNVYVSFMDTRVADNNLDVDVYHITDNKAVELTSEVDEDTVVAVTDSFSYYTVEFTYNSLEYVLEGDSTVALSYILDTVGLQGEATDVTVSDESLFYAYNESGVWYICANRAFNTEEWMVVTIAGTEYEITVTDAASVGYYQRTDGYDIQGVNPTIQTTYNNAGYKTQMSVEGGSNISFRTFEFGKEFGNDAVKGNVTATMAPSGNAVIVTYTVTNYTDEAKSVRIGSSADTKVGNDDEAAVSLTSNGVKMRSNNGNEFYLIPGNGDFTTRWTGAYYNAYGNVFTNANNYSSGMDSGLAFSWTIIVPANRSVTRTVVCTAGNNLTTYTISFNANGGTGTMNNATFISDVPGSIPECEFTRDGYTFMGWAESADSTTVVYEDQGQVTVTSNKQLYAVWLESSVVVVPPTAATGLVYNGSEKTLLATPGSCENGTMQYSIDSVVWTDTVPTKTNAGTYTVYYKGHGDGVNYGDSAVGSLSVTIAKAPIPALTDKNKPTGIDGLVYTGSPLSLVTAPEELPEGYDIQYTLNGVPLPVGQLPIPQTNAGDYVITVKYISTDNNHVSPFAGETINVTIDKAPVPTTVDDSELPTPIEDIEYTGEPQPLVIPPEELPDGFNKVEYSIDGGETWTTEIPTGTNAGDYEVYVRYTDTNNNHDPNNFTSGPVTVTIDPTGAPDEITEDQIPTPIEDLEYTGEPIELIEEPDGTPDGYEVEYSPDGGQTWTTEIPTGTDAGDYVILVRYIDEDGNHSPSIIEGEPITVTIDPMPAPEPETLTEDEIPTAVDNPVFTGDELDLVEENKEFPENYDEVYYSIDGGKTWTNEIPSTYAAGKFVINVKYVDSNGNHEDFRGEDIVVNIALPENPTKFGYEFVGWYADEKCTIPFDPASLEGNKTAPAYASWAEVKYSLIEGENITVNAGSSEGATFRAVRNINETTTFSHHTYVEVDGEKITENEYTKKNGSVIIELKPEYISKLTPGVHTIEIFFDDSYSVKTTFVVNAPATLPSTGETVNYRMIATVGILFVISTSCTIGAFITKKKEEIK